MKKNIAIFASGYGSNFINIFNRISLDSINASLHLLVSNNVGCNAVEFAKKNFIDHFIFNKIRFPENNLANQMLINKLEVYRIDLIILAGYMKKISPKIIRKFNRKILNIHPSLLPLYAGKGYFGEKVHRAVINSGDTKTGATVHFIDDCYDSGPILIQEEVKVKKGDNHHDIAKRVLEVEHRIYPKAIKYFCNENIYWNDDKPFIKEK